MPPLTNNKGSRQDAYKSRLVRPANRLANALRRIGGGLPLPSSDMQNPAAKSTFLPKKAVYHG